MSFPSMLRYLFQLLSFNYSIDQNIWKSLRCGDDFSKYGPNSNCHDYRRNLTIACFETNEVLRRTSQYIEVREWNLDKAPWHQDRDGSGYNSTCSTFWSLDQVERAYRRVAHHHSELYDVDRSCTCIHLGTSLVWMSLHIACIARHASLEICMFHHIICI